MKNRKPADGFTAATVFELLPVAVIGIGPAYEITFINDQALSELDMKREAVLGNMFFTLFEDGPAGVPAARLLRDGVPLRRHEFKTTVQGDSAWVLADSATLPDGAEPENTYLILRNITAGRKREELFSYLNHAAAVLVQTRDTGTALLRIAEFIVPSFADWFTVDVLREGTLELILLRHEDPGKIEWAREYRKAYPPDPKGNFQAAQVIRTGEPVFIPFLTEEMIDQGMQDAVQRSEIKKIGLCSVIMAPMFSGGTVTGLVNFISSRQSRHFDERDLDFALNFANLITLSLENARLHEGAQREIESRRTGEERFRFLLDAIPHKIWTSGPDGRATYYNKQWHEFTGISGFENLREKVWDILHPDDLADAAERWPQAVRTGEDMELENRFRKHDGTYRWHLSRVSPVKDDAGGVMFWIGTSTDIHEQKLYELELAGANEELTAGNEELAAANDELNRTRERLTAAVAGLENSKMRFQLFLDSIPQIAWSGDANAEVTYYNRRWYEYTGLTFDQTSNLPDKHARITMGEPPPNIKPLAWGKVFIAGELKEPVRAMAAETQDEELPLGASVEQFLTRYFLSHGDRLPAPGIYDRIIQEVERPLISICLAATRGNQIRAAQLLGLNRNTLRKKIRDLGLEVFKGLRAE